MQSDCTCLGELLPFTCTTIGVGATVWQGSAFQCPSRNIILRHNLYLTDHGTVNTCNNGAIVGYSLGILDNHYISQLNVTVDSSMAGQIIQCVYDDGTTSHIIGTHTINITTGSYNTRTLI